MRGDGRGQQRPPETDRRVLARAVPAHRLGQDGGGGGGTGGEAGDELVDLRLPDEEAEVWRTSLDAALDEEFVLSMGDRDVRAILAEAILGRVGRTYVAPPLAVRARQVVRPRGGLHRLEALGLVLTALGAAFVVLAVFFAITLLLRVIF